MATRKKLAVESITARSISKPVKRTDITRQVEVSDGISGMLHSIIPTPYNMSFMYKTIESSNILGPCIDAMKVNVVGYGYRIIPYTEDGTISKEDRTLLQSFIDRANVEESLRAVSSSRIVDLERYGFAYMEIIRDRRNRVSLVKHAKSFTTRLLAKTEDAIMVISEVTRGGRKGKVRELKRFRRYMQQANGKTIYFKEFGDPRKLSYVTGRYNNPEVGYSVPDDELATEILHQRLISEDAYGAPRWIAHLPSMIGSRESEEVNMRYFEDNTVPPMVMMVSGGRLTKESFAQLQKLLSQQSIGKDRQNQILLIEAIPETTGLDDKGTVSLQVEKLSDVRPSDGLFSKYDEANRTKIRSSFRLPPVLIGEAEQTSFSSANVSVALAESQVFLPARMDHDEFLNSMLINHPKGFGLKTAKLESRGPSVTNPDQIVRTLTAVNVMGGVTPRKAIELVNETMQLSIEQYPEKGHEDYEIWMDTPMQIAQKLVVATTQQTGEGDHEDDEQGQKNTDIKDRESDGETGTGENAVENGQQNEPVS